jgi:hypothetical protein
MSSIFTPYAAVANNESGDTLFADIANHCAKWSYYRVAGSKCSSAHEATHGINSDLRNAAGGNVNAFYLGQNRSIVIPEPSTRKRDSVQFIPESFRKSRYSLYVTGQNEWDSSPLYLFDEWSAYSNGASAAIDLVKHNAFDEKGTGVIDGTVEFIAYGLATAMAADKAGVLSDQLKAFTAFMVRRSMNAYFSGKDASLLGFGEDEAVANLNGADGEAYRTFMQTKLGLTLPTGPVPEEPDGPPVPPTPTPDKPLNPDDFLMV